MNQDSNLLHFLKQFPGWIVLTILFSMTLWMHYHTQDQFLQRLIDTILGALIGILWPRSPQTPGQSANTQSGDVNVIAPPTDSTPLNELTPTDIEGAVENLEEK